MRLKIDQFYQDRKLGYLKYKGELEGRLLFDRYIEVYGKWLPERATFHRDVILKRLVPSFPPR